MVPLLFTRIICIFNAAVVLEFRKNVTTAIVVGGVVLARPREVQLASVLQRSLPLAGRPLGCPRVFNSGQSVHSGLVHLDTLAVLSGARHILSDSDIGWIVEILDSAPDGELLALGAESLDLGGILAWAGNAAIGSLVIRNIYFSIRFMRQPEGVKPFFLDQIGCAWLADVKFRPQLVLPRGRGC